MKMKLNILYYMTYKVFIVMTSVDITSGDTVGEVKNNGNILFCKY